MVRILRTVRSPRTSIAQKRLSIFFPPFFENGRETLPTRNVRWLETKRKHQTTNRPPIKTHNKHFVAVVQRTRFIAETKGPISGGRLRAEIRDTKRALRPAK